MAFDPMTGEPIEEKKLDNLKFDPMTGEPIKQEAGGFDPMTGKPITQEPDRFDPMTGKPLTQQPDGFDPMTGKPLTNKSKKNLSSKVVIVAAAVFVVIIVLIGFTSGLFLGKAGKVMLAMANTVKDGPHIAKDLGSLGILAGKKYTVSISGEMNDMKFDGELRVNGNDKQIAAQLDGDGYSKVKMLAGIDSKAVKCEIPDLSKNVFTYNYKGKNTGYMMEMLSERDIEELNSSLEYIAGSNKDVNKYNRELIKVFKNEIKKLKFTNAEKEEYTINEKDVNCKGYVATITGTNMVHIVDGVEDVVNDYLDALEDSDVIDLDDLADAFEDLRDDFEDMEGIEFTAYIYKNKLAAVVLENLDSRDKIELCFEGGDYRTQNMTLKSSGYRLQLSGSDNGTKEKFVLKERQSGRDSVEIGSLEYSYKNGKISASLDNASMSAKLTKSSSGLTLKLDELHFSYVSVSPNLTISVEKGAKMEKYSGKEFDLGNADEDEWEELVDDIEDELYDSDLYYMINNLERALRNF